MGLLGLFKRRKKPNESGASEAGADADERNDEPPPIAIAIVREGMAPPSDDEMRSIVEVEAPECLELPRTGLAQPRWWRQQEWVPGGMRQIARALIRTYDNDPDEAAWDVVTDDRGARVGIVYLYPKG